jgi:hypothetical protein
MFSLLGLNDWLYQRQQCTRYHVGRFALYLQQDESVQHRTLSSSPRSGGPIAPRRWVDFSFGRFVGAARARGRSGGRKPKMTPAKLRLAQAAMSKRGTIVADLCGELGVSSQTLYRHVSPTGELRASGKKIISKSNL